MCSLPNLVKLELKRKVIIYALIEQIDAVFQDVNPNEFSIQIFNNTHSPMLESESLFKK